MAHLELQFLGGFQASLDQLPISGFESDKVRALLVYLSVEQAQPHRREKLAGMFWPEQPEERARRNLSQALYNLRSCLHDQQALTPFLFLEREQVRWNRKADARLDAIVFLELLSAVQWHAHPDLMSCSACQGRLNRAVDLYKGEFLAGVLLDSSTVFEEWVLVQRERLRRQALLALQNLSASLEQRGELDQALVYTWQALEIEPLWEPAQRQAMRLLAATGQRSAALLQYESCRRLLADELGIQPEAQTTRLYQSILAAPETTPDEAANGQKTTGVPPNNLPSPLTPFVGRVDELAEINKYLESPTCRLVTILGPGGSGKTRLAIEAARAQLERFSGGIYLVPLAVLQSGQLLLPAVALALELSLHEGEDPQAQLFEFLRPRQMLLILDNFETVLDGAAWTGELLHACPQLKLLVTSRSQLNLKGEQLFKLTGMRYPKLQAGVDGERVDLADFSPAAYSALALFQDAVGRAKPNLTWDEFAWQAAARICALVHGMPLGLLLAASWAANYNLAQIAAEIERSLDFLSADWVDVPARQRSLRATFDYSWQLLQPGEQAALSRLAVFNGGFTHTAARAALDVQPASLRVLQGKCRLERQPDGRFGMHELLRQYAIEKLAADPQAEHAACDQHAGYYLGLLPGWAEGIKSDRQAAVLAEMAQEVGNIGAAWRWAVEHGQLEALQAGLEGLGLFYYQGFRYTEGEAICWETSELLAGRGLTVGWQMLGSGLLVWQAFFDFFQGKNQFVPGLLKSAEELLESSSKLDLEVRKMTAFLNLVQTRCEKDLQRRMAFCRASLALYRTFNEPWWTAQCLELAGEFSNRLGEFQIARDNLLESLETRMEIKEPRAIAKTAQALSYVYAWRGEGEAAYQAVRTAADHYHAAGDTTSNAEAMRLLGTILNLDGRFSEGVSQLIQSLPVLRAQGQRFSVLYNLRSLGIGYVYLGEYANACPLLQEALEMARQYGLQREAAAANLGLGCASLAEGKLEASAGAFLECITLLRSMGYVSELGWVLGSLALVYLALGDESAAQACILEGLQLALKSEAILTYSTCLPAAACLLAKRDRWQDALQVYAAAETLPLVRNSRWHAQVCGLTIAASAEQLDSEQVMAARQCGQVSGPGETVRWLLDQWQNGLDLEQAAPGPDQVQHRAQKDQAD